MFLKQKYSLSGKATVVIYEYSDNSYYWKWCVLFLDMAIAELLAGLRWILLLSQTDCTFFLL